ncbi:MAG: hypothetical protein H8E17_14540 [Deltaproteobacteria bacterium]|nr:hypothetical protein [Deltaproteobacteria bacterium]
MKDKSRPRGRRRIAGLRQWHFHSQAPEEQIDLTKRASVNSWKEAFARVFELGVTIRDPGKSQYTYAAREALQELQQEYEAANFVSCYIACTTLLGELDERYGLS